MHSVEQVRPLAISILAHFLLFSAEDNKPLIPVSSSFLLVTDSSIAEQSEPSPSENPADVPQLFYQSYFDRPEVIKSYREQEVIETPVFNPLPDDAIGSRFRMRSGDEVLPFPLLLAFSFT